MAQHVCFALFVRNQSARDEVDGGESAGAAALGESPWVNAQDGIDNLW
jgi:hypothetical protein